MAATLRAVPIGRGRQILSHVVLSANVNSLVPPSVQVAVRDSDNQRVLHDVAILALLFDSISKILFILIEDAILLLGAVMTIDSGGGAGGHC